MGVFEKICLEMLEKCRQYANDGDYTEMIKYLDKKEKQVERCRKMSKTDSEYVDSLVTQLK